MKANLIRNENGDLAFVYGEDLGFVPDVAAIDVERGELSVLNEDNFKRILIEGMDDALYKQLSLKTHILLVEVENNDFTKPKKAAHALLTVPQQI